MRMKGKLLIGLIPLAAGTALLGTGFSIFHFNASRDETLNPNVTLDLYAEVGSARIANAAIPSLLFTDRTIVDFSDWLEIVYTPGDGWGTSSFYVNLDVTLDTSSAPDVMSYIDILTSQEGEETWRGSGNTYTLHLSNAFLPKEPGSESRNEFSYIFQSWPIFYYEDGKRPTDTNTLSSLVSKVKDDTLKFTFRLSLGDEVVSSETSD